MAAIFYGQVDLLVFFCWRKKRILCRILILINSVITDKMGENTEDKKIHLTLYYVLVTLLYKDVLGSGYNCSFLRII